MDALVVFTPQAIRSTLEDRVTSRKQRPDETTTRARHRAERLGYKMEHEMQEQLVVHPFEPTEQEFAQRKKSWQLRNGHSSPIYGMWTLTFMDVKRGSAWVQLGLCGGAAGAFNPQAGSWQSWKLIVDEGARVYHIDSAEALDKLVIQYPHYGQSAQLGSSPSGQPAPYPNWDKVRQDYDAVHLTESGLRALGPRLPYWDCENTVWFEWKFRDVINLGMLPFVV